MVCSIRYNNEKVVQGWVLPHPDGEFVWMISVIAGVAFGGINLGIQASNGDINNFGVGLKAFGLGFDTRFPLDRLPI
ncbi:MAG: hypothetical protein ABR574_11420 [Cryomorphaceae bacterium]|nr:hypothetical protein [Flavobacteriales bacterium]